MRGDVPPASLVVGNPGKVVADVTAVAAWHRQAATRGPAWPHEGWTVGRGITDARKRAQREALANGNSGYLAATPDRPGVWSAAPNRSLRGR